jgi:hypothetical protein
MSSPQCKVRAVTLAPDAERRYRGPTSDAVALAACFPDPRRPELVSQLSDLFERFAREGTVSFQLSWRTTWSKLR